jgi:hypothetical protein
LCRFCSIPPTPEPHHLPVTWGGRPGLVQILWCTSGTSPAAPSSTLTSLGVVPVAASQGTGPPKLAVLATGEDCTHVPCGPCAAHHGAQARLGRLAEIRDVDDFEVHIMYLPSPPRRHPIGSPWSSLLARRPVGERRGEQSREQSWVAALTGRKPRGADLWLAYGCLWLAYGWPMAGLWLPMTGLWLPMAGLWLAYGWLMAGLWLAYGWHPRPAPPRETVDTRPGPPEPLRSRYLRRGPRQPGGRLGWQKGGENPRCFEPQGAPKCDRGVPCDDEGAKTLDVSSPRGPKV